MLATVSQELADSEVHPSGFTHGAHQLRDKIYKYQTGGELWAELSV